MIIGVDSKREYQCEFLYQFQPSIVFGSDIIIRQFM